MSNELTPYSDSRDITQYTESPHMYPQYAVRYDDQGHGFDLHSIWGFVRRSWWILAGFLALGLSLAVAYNRMARPVYQASATIQVKDEAAATNPTGFDMFTGTSDIATDMMVLRSRTLAEEVVDSLQLQARLQEPMGLPRSEIFAHVRVDRSARAANYEMERRSDGTFDLRRLEGQRLAVVRPGQEARVGGITFTLASTAGRYKDIRFRVRPFQAAVAQVKNRVDVVIPGKDAQAGIIQITYQDSDPELTAEIPNALAHQFIVHRRREHKRTASNTVAFLRGQLDTLSVQLRDAEERLRDYREAARIVNIEAEGASKIGQLAAAQAQRDQLAVEYSSLAQLRSRLTADPSAVDPLAPSPYRRIIAFPGLLGNASLSNMLSQLTSLENERSELLERRTMEDPEVQNLTGRIKALEDQMQGQVDTYLEGLSNQLSAVGSVVGRNAGELSTIPRKEYELASLLRQAELYQAAFIQLQTRLKEAEITEAVEDPNVGIVDLALAPKKPIKPRRGWNLLLGALLGLLLGVGSAYTREFLDSRVHTREELRDLTGVPVLGLIPRITAATVSFQSYPRRLLKTAQTEAGNGKTGETTALAPRLVTEIDRNSAVSEAYRSLRTNITFSSTAERLSKIFVLTSPTPKDGKTTTAANLAVTFAQQGLKVLLVDADMRRGILHKLFRLPRTPGLSNILVENSEMERAIHWAQLDQGTQIDVLPTGTVPPNPAELLSSSQMRWLIERLRERYDAIVFDTPPLTLVTDAAILASFADIVLLVARSNKTEHGAISFAMEQLRNVGAPVRGAILNDVDFKRDGRYGRYGKYDYYAYSYDYGRTEED